MNILGENSGFRSNHLYAPGQDGHQNRQGLVCHQSRPRVEQKDINGNAEDHEHLTNGKEIVMKLIQVE